MFRKLLSFDEAKRIIQEHFKPTFLGEEEIVLMEASNRVLSENVFSTLDIPPCNRLRLNG